MQLSNFIFGTMMCCLVLPSTHASESQLGIRTSDMGQIDDDEEGGFPRIYLGAGFGRAHDSSPYIYSSDLDLYTVFIGVNYNKYFGTELSFVKVEDTNGGQSNYAAGLGGNHWSAAGVATLPLSNYFESGLEIGYANFSTRTTSTSTSSSNGSWTYGVFTTANLSNHIAIRAEYEGLGYGGDTITIVSLNAIYKF
jgi:opacity protein-like surface antigen